MIALRSAAAAINYSAKKRSELRSIWAELTYQMQRLRDNPECAEQEFEAKKNPDDKGLSAFFDFTM